MLMRVAAAALAALVAKPTVVLEATYK